MKKTFDFYCFMRKRTFIHAATCLILASGATALPAYSENAESTVPAVTGVQQNTLTMKGTVVDVKGDPIIGASIIEKGTKNATVTDLDGNFVLKTKPGSTISITYIGYISQEIKASAKANIVLEEDLRSLNEVVVIGYGTQKKGDVTSAITSVKSDEFIKGNVNDAAELIKGKVAGLTIANGSGDPSSESTIRLRGVISLKGSSTPLVLVDGVEGSLNTVTPENIESIDVLKDASAAAIYGTRGANGVIIITTKSGRRESKTTVNYAGYMSLSSFGKKLEFMDGSDIRAGKTQFTDRGYDTDWLDAVSRTAFTHNQNVSINGGNKSTAYSADFSYRDNQGVFINTYRQRMRFNGMVSHWMFNDMIKLQFNIFKSWRKNGPLDAASSLVYSNAVMRNPTEPIYAEDGTYYENFGAIDYFNPVGIIKESKGNTKHEMTRLTGNITFEPIKGWQTNLMLSTERYNEHTEGYRTSQHYSQRSQGRTGYAYHNYYYGETNNLELTSTYRKHWGEHRLEALIGYSYLEDNWEQFNANNYNFINDFFQYNNLGLGTALKEGKAGMGSWASDDKLIGFFGRVSYGYADKYNVLVSVRREGSSKFGENNKWGTFPSASLGWTISNEKFMSNIKWLDNLKLRAGVGVTGVIPNSPYISLTRWSVGGSYYYDDGQWKQAINIASNPNPNLKWEKSTEWNFGLDWSVLKGRLSGTVDVYVKNTKDLLWDYTVPTPPNLYNTTTANVGQLRNKGVEIAITAVPIRTKDFEWSSTLTGSHNSNKLISLSNDLYETADYQDVAWLGGSIQITCERLQVGKSVGNFYGMKSVGVSENGLWMIENPKTGQAEEMTDAMIGDKENWHQYLGNALPKVYMGWNNTFTYKNFDLTMQFTGQFGFKIFNETRAFYENNSIAYNRLKSVGKSPYNSGYTLGNSQKQTFVSYYLENGDFVKCSNITLGYNVPIKQNKYITSARVYLAGSNLFTITGYQGLDPELSNSDLLSPGIDWHDKYPSTRTFTFGLNLTF